MNNSGRGGLREHPDDPGDDGWAAVSFRDDDAVEICRARPDFWRDFRRRKWKRLPSGVLVCPGL